MIDNYDSFTYNLVQYLGELGAEVERRPQRQGDGRRTCSASSPTALVVSPGAVHARRRPGSRSRRSARSPRRALPSLGVCLGHQSLVEAFGGKVVRGDPIHGKDAEVQHDGRAIYEGLPNPLVAGRYHSLVADPDLPEELELTSTYGDVVMGVRHRELPAEGVQFHPESVLTPQGKTACWLTSSAPSRARPPKMPNDILTRAIDEICAGTHLTADHTSAALGEIMEGQGGGGPDRRLPDRAARQGGDRRRAGRPCTDDAGAGRPRRDREPRDLWTRPAPAAARRPSTSPPPRL